MFKFLAPLVLAMTALPAFSQTCYVDMINRSSQVVRSYTAHDNNDACKEGMKQCRLDLRTQPHLGGVDCIRDGRQTPRPRPVPGPGPRPIPRPRPDNRYPQHINIGEDVYNVSNNRYAEVISQDHSGKFVLRFRDNGAVGTGWSREDLAPLRGCDQDLCVNDRVYNVSNNRYAVVVGLQLTNKFVLRFEDNGQTGDGWARADLSALQGCYHDLCVGEQVYNVSNNRYARVTGFQLSGKFVLRFEDNGQTGDGWDRNDLAVTKGCQMGLCVGSRVINIQNRREATIAALQAGNKFVLRFHDNGQTGDGWSLNDLAPLR